MDHMKRIMTMRPETVLVDKYGGADFTVNELSAMIVYMMQTDTKEAINDFLERFVDKSQNMPRIAGPVADSWVIERGESPRMEWLTPEREWQGSLFAAARFELDEREKAEWWLQREIDAELLTGAKSE